MPPSALQQDDGERMGDRVYREQCPPPFQTAMTTPKEGSSNDGPAIKDLKEPPRDDARHELDAQHVRPDHKRLQRAGADFARQQMPRRDRSGYRSVNCRRGTGPPVAPVSDNPATANRQCANSEARTMPMIGRRAVDVGFHSYRVT